MVNVALALDRVVDGPPVMVTGTLSVAVVRAAFDCVCAACAAGPTAQAMSSVDATIKLRSFRGMPLKSAHTVELRYVLRPDWTPVRLSAASILDTRTSRTRYVRRRSRACERTLALGVRGVDPKRQSSRSLGLSFAKPHALGDRKPRIARESFGLVA